MSKHYFARLGFLFAASLAVSQGASISIQPIQVCDNSGANCANASRQLFHEFTSAIWAQAGIEVNVLPWNQLNHSGYRDLESMTELSDLFSGASLITQANPLDTVISIWFVGNAANAYGWSALGGNRIAIGDAVFSYVNPRLAGIVGRFDTIAHEIGHSLGLDHCDGDCGDYLMADGAIRSVSVNLGEIGLYDRISATDVAIARQSWLVRGDAQVAPEPSTWAMGLAGVGFVIVNVRRRRQKQR